MRAQTSNADRKKIIQEYYSARAKDYDRQKSRTWKSDQGFADDVFEETFNALRGLEKKLVLEVGIGSGRNAKPLLEKISPQLVGLDLSRKMLMNAQEKLFALKKHFDLILGDAEHLPFLKHSFEGIVCMSTLHYFADQEKALQNFAALLKEKGTFVYGDLSPHESDNRAFFEKLEGTLSKAHKRYHKASEMENLMEENGFRVARTKTILYTKSYDALLEDKAKYFNVDPQLLHRHVQTASKETREQYDLTQKGLTQFYTVIIATRKSDSE